MLVSPVVDDPLTDVPLCVHENATLDDTDTAHVKLTVELTATTLS